MDQWLFRDKGQRTNYGEMKQGIYINRTKEWVVRGSEGERIIVHKWTECTLPMISEV